MQRPAVDKGGVGQGAKAGGGQGTDSGGGQGADSGAAAVKKKKTLKVTLRVKRSNSGTFAVQKPDSVFSGSAGKIHLLLKSSSTFQDIKRRIQQLLPHHCLFTIVV